MRVAAIQMSPEFGQVEKNFDRAEALLAEARADLAVLPEFAFTGYAFLDRNELAQFAEATDGRSVRRMIDGARRLGGLICFGFPERAGEKIYNAAALVGPSRLLAVYHKIHLFRDEPEILDPGDTPFFVTEVNGVRLGMMICYDWFFPESARSLALQGAQIILHPANLLLPFCQDAMVTRCVENRVFAITANRNGAEQRNGKRLKFTGRSQIARPDATYDRLKDGADGILVAEIDPAQADDKFLTDRKDLLHERRPKLYRLD